MRHYPPARKGTCPTPGVAGGRRRRRPPALGPPLGAPPLARLVRRVLAVVSVLIVALALHRPLQDGGGAPRTVPPDGAADVAGRPSLLKEVPRAAVTVAVSPPKHRAVRHRGRRRFLSGQGDTLVLGADPRVQQVQSHPRADVEGRDGPPRPLVGALARPLPLVQLLQPGGCSGSCPHSQRGITPSENPAQDAERYARVTTRAPGSLGAKRTKTTEATQTHRSFIRTRTVTPKHTLIYPQKQDAGRAQSRPPGASMGGPVPNGPRSQARASSGPCPASLTALPLEGDPCWSRAEAGKSLRLPTFQDLPKTNTSGLIPRFFNFPG